MDKSEAERLAERLEHALRMYELPRGVCIDIRQAAALIRAQSARMAAIEEALRPFAGMRKSTEPEVSDLLNRSPSEQLRRQAELTERRDREIDNARLALGKGSE